MTHKRLARFMPRIKTVVVAALVEIIQNIAGFVGLYPARKGLDGGSATVERSSRSPEGSIPQKFPADHCPISLDVRSQMKTARADEARAVKLSLILENGVILPKNSEGRKQRQQKSESVKLSRDVREIDLDKFSLPTDGRKRKRLSRDRQAAAGWLATFGDGDGSRIFPGLKKMARHFGWSERKCDYVIADLKTLGILIPSTAKRDGQHGNAKQWEMIPSALNVEAQDSQIVEAQDSILEAQK